MSWESSSEYYRLMNQEVARRLGGLHSAQIAMYSLEFAPVEQAMGRDDWSFVAAAGINAALSIEKSGADFLVMATNTLHKCAPEIEKSISIPLLHIADPTALAIRSAGFKKIGLLGTRFTMEQDFYTGRLSSKWGLNVLIPNPSDCQLVNRVIFDELCKSRIRPESKREYQRIISELASSGAEAVILGCTEIMLLVKQQDASVPLFDTTELHCKAAVDRALE